uniref:Protein kinase domain-containing protein n=1 Tax=Fagus sylvatica TaxID=28930 RepID=A0A2N9FT61_FAGSY
MVKFQRKLGHLFRLQHLNLSNNTLGGEIPASLTNCSELRVLNIAWNKLIGKIPMELGSLTKLFSFLVPRNNLTGGIPPSLGNLSLLVSFAVGYNNLEGNIPESIGHLKSLEFFGAGVNKLTGQIPNSLGNLTQLVELFLDRNNFEGSIPPSIGNCQSLQQVGCFTKLPWWSHTPAGELPTEGVFRNVSMTSVIGNNKLCGGIPQLQLPTCLKVKKSRKSLASRLRITIVCVVTCFLLVSSLLVLYWRIKSKKKPSSQVSKMDLLPNISYKMLHQATNGFSLNNLIGSGSFGSVYKGVLDQEERLVAVKVLNLEKKGAPKSFVAECNVLRNVRHRNLIKILTCCSSINYNGDEFKALVFEFMTNGNLDMWLHPMTDSENQSKNLSVLQRLIIAIDVASALNYLHDHCEQQIIHCDLKPSNILLDNEMIAHVSDFGLARLLSTNSDSSQKRTSTIGLMGSIGYAAPEYGMGADASTMGDVYSYGILVLEMFTGRRPTDDMFKDGLNLHNFVKMALPKRLIHVVDPMLLPREAEEMGVATVAIVAIEEEDDKDSEIEVEANSIEDFRQIDADLKKCLLSILNIGIICSMESPQERMSMEAVIKELQLIKNTFDGSGIHKGRSSQAQIKGA